MLKDERIGSGLNLSLMSNIISNQPNEEIPVSLKRKMYDEIAPSPDNALKQARVMTPEDQMIRNAASPNRHNVQTPLSFTIPQNGTNSPAIDEEEQYASKLRLQYNGSTTSNMSDPQDYPSVIDTGQENSPENPNPEGVINKGKRAAYIQWLENQQGSNSQPVSGLLQQLYAIRESVIRSNVQSDRPVLYSDLQPLQSDVESNYETQVYSEKNLDDLPPLLPYSSPTTMSPVGRGPDYPQVASEVTLSPTERDANGQDGPEPIDYQYKTDLISHEVTLRAMGDGRNLSGLDLTQYQAQTLNGVYNSSPDNLPLPSLIADRASSDD